MHESSRATECDGGGYFGGGAWDSWNGDCYRKVSGSEKTAWGLMSFSNT